MIKTGEIYVSIAFLAVLHVKISQKITELRKKQNNPLSLTVGCFVASMISNKSLKECRLFSKSRILWPFFTCYIAMES